MTYFPQKHSSVELKINPTKMGIAAVFQEHCKLTWTLSCVCSMIRSNASEEMSLLAASFRNCTSAEVSTISCSTVSQNNASLGKPYGLFIDPLRGFIISYFGN